MLKGFNVLRITFVLLVLSSAFPFAAQATLIDRGNGLIYDDVLDITWLQDANFGGAFNHQGALDFADSLVFQGFDDWRLPSMDVNGDGDVVECVGVTEMTCRDNELGYMYYYNLDGVLGANLTGDQGLLQNIQLSHWSNILDAFNPIAARLFSFSAGLNFASVREGNLGAWAVRSGDVIAAPAPASLTLIVVGLLGLVASRKVIGRRR